MRLFNLYPKGRAGWPRWDVMEDITVRAKNEQRARELAAENCGGEGKDVWLDESRSYCDVVTARGPECVITRDFSAG